MYWASDIKICGKNPLGLSCLLDFRYFSTNFWHFSAYSSHFCPDVCCETHTTHLCSSHWTCNHTWIGSNKVAFCMSCYYHSYLIIPYLAQILGFWVTCGVKMMSLCHCWGWQPPQNNSHIHIRHIKSVWAHWYANHCLQYQPYTVIPTLLGSDFGVQSHLWSQNDVIMSWLSLTATWNYSPHPYWTYTKCLSTLICCRLG